MRPESNNPPDKSHCTGSSLRTCADMESLIRLAGEHNLYIIEDGAQATGADYIFADGSRKKQELGPWNNIILSSKNLGCYGDGGALYTK